MKNDIKKNNKLPQVWIKIQEEQLNDEHQFNNLNME
jgi:hypothetical protein